MEHGNTAIGPVWRELRRRFAEGSRSVGHDGWRRWLRTVLAGAAGVLLLLFGLLAAGQRLLAAGALDWETAFLLGLEHGPFSFADAVFFQTFGSDITLFVLVAATAGIAAWARRPIAALSIVLAPLVVDIIGRIGWALWARARPDVLYEGFASPGFHSFPSGHTSKTTAAWGVLALLWITASRSTVERAVVAALLLFIVLVVPFGRMAMGVHWPSDVVAGFLLGAAWLAVLGYALRVGEHGKARGDSA